MTTVRNDRMAKLVHTRSVLKTGTCLILFLRRPFVLKVFAAKLQSPSFQLTILKIFATKWEL